MIIEQGNLSRQLRDFGLPVEDGEGTLVISGLFTLENLTRPSGISVARNRVVTEGLNYMAGVSIGSTSRITTWYLAPFAGNVTPQANLTAANFNSVTTEFTSYDEGARQEFTPGSPAAGVIGNLSARAEITVADGAQDVIYGLGVISASAKGGGSDSGATLFAAARFSSTRSGLLDGDVLALGYQLSVIDPTA